MKNQLNYTIEKTRWLFVRSFDSYNDTSGETDSFIIPEEITADEIHQKVIDLKNDEGTCPPRRRKIKYAYSVTDEESMTDDREKFGHKNQTSERCIGEFIPLTYTMGVVKTLDEFIGMSELDRFSDTENKKLDRFIELLTSSLFNPAGRNRDELSEEDLTSQAIMIEGIGDRITFFEEFKEGYQLKTIPLLHCSKEV